jgi:hypothetical protein
MLELFAGGQSEVCEVCMIREFIFVSLVGFLVAWTLISAWGMIQAMTGFTDTYASIVASSPALGTEAARQSTLQGVIISNAVKWAIVAVPLALLALLAKW